MLKKIRWRFIGSAMAAFTAVILMLLCFINVWNYHSVTNQQDDALQRISERDNQGAPDFPDKKPPKGKGEHYFSAEVQYSLRFFSVHYNTDGEFLRADQDHIASLDEETEKEYAQTALGSGKTSGYKYGYRFLVYETDTEKVVLFLNSEREIQTMNSLFWITVAIAGVSLVIVFGLVVLFSRRAIRPYAKNMEAQKQFITNASHELKTPLTAISTSADVLALEYEEDEWVQNIQTQSTRLSKLITSLVALSRLNEENPFPEREEFSLSDAIWESSEPFVHLAKANGYEYLQDIEDDIRIVGNQTAIQQMISILLDNAMKYAAKDAPIELKLGKCGKKAEIIVSNKCEAGRIPDVSRLFERFYRGDQSHSPQISGTGIGLSIVKATVDAHGGRISAAIEDERIVFKILL